MNVSDRILSKKSPFNLCIHIVNSQRLFCSQKGGVKCSYNEDTIFSFKYNFYVMEKFGDFFTLRNSDLNTTLTYVLKIAINS